MPMRPALFLILYLLSFSSALWAGDSRVVIIDNDFRYISQLGSLPTYIADGYDLTAQQALHQSYSLQNYQRAQEPSEDVFWHKLELQGRFNQQLKQTITLVASTHNVEEVDFYLLEGNTQLAHSMVGIKQLKGMPLGKYNGMKFSFEIQSGQTLTLLVRKQSSHITLLPLGVYSSDHYQTYSNFQFIFWGGIAAVLLAISIYNCGIFVLVGGRPYIWYLAFYLASFVYFGSLHGYGLLLWSPEVHSFLQQYSVAMHLFQLWLFLMFARGFMRFKHFNQHTDKPVLIFSLLLWPAIVLALFLPYAQAFGIFIACFLVVGSYIIYACFTALRQGFVPVRLFLASAITVFVGAMISILAYNSLIVVNFFTIHAFFFGSVAELCLLSIALADRLKFAERIALSQAYTDPKTKLANYSFYQQQFPQILRSIARRHQSLHLVVYKYKGLRDYIGLFGPQTVDRSYLEVSQRTDELLGKYDWAINFDNGSNTYSHLIALSSDQILLLVPGHKQLNQVIQELTSVLNLPIAIGDYQGRMKYHLGSAFFDAQTMHIDDAFRHAQLALLDAEDNAMQWVMFDPEFDRMARERFSLLNELRQALDNDELYIEIQPQFCFSDRAVVGGEVLVRWSHPRLGTLYPGGFIPLAEKSGLIYSVTQIVIEKSFDWLSQQSDLPEDFHLSINLSTLDIHESDLLSFIDLMLDRYKINPEQVLFEVTESAILKSVSGFLAAIKQLRNRGFQIAIDDFGTGYSSLSYIKDIQADVIKIDMSFIRDIQHSSVSENIVKAIISLAHSTEAVTVAEGVEYGEEYKILENLGADIIQGFYLAKPVSIDEYSQRFVGKKLRILGPNSQLDENLSEALPGNSASA